ncbi:MAG: four helix bundle protein [Candidatus Kapabacteria bacterium]|nr:four helix bundle protein [Candidatus Kapabacteria bacterium]
MMVQRDSSPLHFLSVEFSRGARRLVLTAYKMNVVERSPLDQMYRAGTSVGANIRESKYAESTKDFIHKLKIAEKELAEFFFWLGLLSTSPDIFDAESADALKNLGREIMKMLSSIITSIKRKNNL